MSPLQLNLLRGCAFRCSLRDAAAVWWSEPVALSAGGAGGSLRFLFPAPSISAFSPSGVPLLETDSWRRWECHPCFLHIPFLHGNLLKPIFGSSGGACSVYSDYLVDVFPSPSDSLSMMNAAEHRLDPSRLSREELDQLANVVIEDGRPALIGREGVRIELPDPIFHMLVRVIRMMREGRAIVLFPEDETFTTQAAANFLGMSRQFFVNLIESGQIPFHRVGAHRRVYLKDLMAYQKRRDKERREGMHNLFKAVEEAGVYDQVLPKDDEQR